MAYRRLVTDGAVHFRGRYFSSLWLRSFSGRGDEELPLSTAWVYVVPIGGPADGLVVMTEAREVRDVAVMLPEYVVDRPESAPATSWSPEVWSDAEVHVLVEVAAVNLGLGMDRKLSGREVERQYREVRPRAGALLDHLRDLARPMLEMVQAALSGQQPYSVPGPDASVVAAVVEDLTEAIRRGVLAAARRDAARGAKGGGKRGARGRARGVH